jgi:di/tricarboxylate transporter
MDFKLAVTLIVLALMVLGMLQELIGVEVIMLACLIVLVLFDVVPINDALAGFSNTAVITIAALYVVGLGMRTTGALESVSKWLFGKPGPQTSRLRLFAPLAALSAFMNNTPLVAFFLPIFIQIARRMRVSPSQLLIPLSYATILGGTCTMVGTSTNLVVAGVMEDQKVAGGAMTFFELAPVGLCLTAVGLFYLVTVGRRLLPNRQDLMDYIETHPREYSIEMIVRPGCALAGQSVRAGGLRDLPGLYLYRIERSGVSINPVGPEEVLRVGDILHFSGVAATVVDLQKIRGLDPIDHRTFSQAPELTPLGSAPGQLASLDSLEGLPPAAPPQPLRRRGRQLCEVVVSSTAPLLGQSIKDADFRARYNAAIIAVHRSGEKIEQKIGQIVLRAGDTLLIDANDDFVRRWRHSPDFILVSDVEDSAPVRHERSWLALFIFGGVLLGMSMASESGNLNPTIVALCGAVLMLFSRCVRSHEAVRSMDLSVIVLVASALGIGKAMRASHADRWFANGLLALFQDSHPVVLLAAIYLLTMLLSELLSNNATAALVSTLAIEVAELRGLNARPFLIAIAVAASCAFATPIGYQTHLMVLNPGGYRFRDFIRVGVPLDLVCFAVAMIVIPMVWRLAGG